MEKKVTKREKLVFLIKVMSGGGAERVVSVLSNGLVNRGYDISIILTHQSLKDAKLNNLDKRIEVLSIEDNIEDLSNSEFFATLKMVQGRIESKLSKIFRKKESNKGLIDRYYARNYDKVKWLKSDLKDKTDVTLIAFLYDSIFLSILAKTKEQKLIISERGDPEQSLGSRTTMAFLHSMFKKADGIVFQSPDVSTWYNDNIGVEGKVIFNPIKKDLPKPYVGNRQKKIVNFCRISDQKNLELLVKAFHKLHNEYLEYELYIYGDAVGNGAEGYLERIKSLVEEFELQSAVNILPSRTDIHEEIKDYAMFVSSSDFEGMSNSMLEAMAMGMPVVCTDCPAGGARAVIRNNENGLLVPVRDTDALYQAMKKVIEEPELAEKIAENASKIRETQSVENIIKQWMEIING